MRIKRTIYIYVEGKGEIVFLSQFISNHFNFDFEYNLDELKATCEDSSMKISMKAFDSSSEGGIDNRKIQNLIEEISQINSQIGVESIILIDADTELHKKPKGGFEARSDLLNSFKSEVNFEYFIIPNHQDDGNLEDLLDGIISSKGLDFYRCLTRYSDCLGNLEEAAMPLELKRIKDFKKKRMEWYSFNMIGGKVKRQQKMENYQSGDLWDLNSSSLSSLKEFFAGIFSPNPHQ